MSKYDNAKSPLILSVAQVGPALNVSEGTVRKLIHSKELEAFQVGRRWLVPLNSLESWLDKKMNQ